MSLVQKVADYAIVMTEVWSPQSHGVDIGSGSACWPTWTPIGSINDRTTVHLAFVVFLMT
jgi:hypothetical protein